MRALERVWAAASGKTDTNLGARDAAMSDLAAAVASVAYIDPRLSELGTFLTKTYEDPNDSSGLLDEPHEAARHRSWQLWLDEAWVAESDVGIGVTAGPIEPTSN